MDRAEAKVQSLSTLRESAYQCQHRPSDDPFFAEKKRVESHITRYHLGLADYLCYIKVITKLPNSEQSYKGKVKTHNYINRQNQSTTGKL